MNKKGDSWFLIKDKKGGEKLLSIWWFFVLTVIGGGIVLGVLIYNHADINVKEVESDILAERIVGCLVDNSYLNKDFLNNDSNIFSECKINQELFGKGSNFYFKISVFDEDGNLLRGEIIEGDSSFEEECEISGVIKARHFPRCSVKNEGVLYFKGGKVIKGKLNVLAGSNQNGKKVVI